MFTEANRLISKLGLKYIPDYISTEHEAQLIEIIDEQNWLNDLKRRVQHYGYKYDYKVRDLRSNYLGPMPEWLLNLCNNLMESRIFNIMPNQVIINEYQPGQGIAPHINCIPCFGDIICSLSLGSYCVMDFSKDEKLSLLLEPRSLIVMSDQARLSWKHGITARKQDLYLGNKFLRKRRISITFRNVV